MAEIKNAKLIRVGSSFCITVPRAYIKNGLVDTDKQYNVVIKEATEEDGGSTQA